MKKKIIGSHESIYKKPKTDISDFIKGNFLPSAAIMFRRSAIDDFSVLSNYKIVDYPLYLHLLNNENSYALSIFEAMAVYRVHNQGIHSKQNSIQRLRTLKNVYTKFRPHLNKNSILFNASIIKVNYHILYTAVTEKLQLEDKALLKRELLKMNGGIRGFMTKISFILLLLFPKMIVIANHIYAISKAVYRKYFKNPFFTSIFKGI